MIEINHLSKRYGARLAVDDLTFTVRPGRVTGFLGPNGAGKSTTMRAIIGLDRPTAGEVLVNGRRYVDLPAPLREVGALLDAKAMHPGRTGPPPAGPGRHRRDRRARVLEVLELVGLADVARHRTRLLPRHGSAAGHRGGPAGRPRCDPAGRAGERAGPGRHPLDPRVSAGAGGRGGTVFVSSHLMSEMAMTADHLVILGRGRLLADVPTAEMIAATSPSVRVRSPQAAELEVVLRAEGVRFDRPQPELLVILDRGADEIAELAFAHQVVLHELTATHGSLEDAYLELTRNELEYSTTPTANPTDLRRVA